MNKKCKDGWTPLMYAASKGHGNICQTLISKGAKADVSDTEVSEYLIGKKIVGRNF